MDVDGRILINLILLRVVVYDGWFDIVSCLVENGVDVNVCNNFENIFFMVVCYNGYMSVVIYFIKKGVDMDL